MLRLNPALYLNLFENVGQGRAALDSDRHVLLMNLVLSSLLVTITLGRNHLDMPTGRYRGLN